MDFTKCYQGAVWYFVFCVCQVSTGLGEDIRARLDREAPAAWAQIEARARQASIECTLKSTATTASGDTADTEAIRVLRKDSWVLYEHSHRVDGRPTAELYCIGPDGAFSLSRPTSQDSWILQFASVVPPTEREDRTKLRFRASVLTTWPVLVGGLPLTQLVNDPRFEIKAVGECHEQGAVEPLVCLTFAYNPPEERAREIPMRGGTIVLAPSKQWRVERTDLRTSYGSVSSRIVYRAEAAGAADVESVTDVISSSKGRQTLVYSYSSVDFSPPSDEAFRLAQYGMPDVLSSLRRRSLWSRWYVVVAVAVGLFLVGAALRRLARRCAARQSDARAVP